MNTDTLIEHTYITKPNDPFWAVKFTEWTQVDALRALLDAQGFKLTYLLSRNPLPIPQVHVAFTFDPPRYPEPLMELGDYLVTHDPETWVGDNADTDYPAPRRWNVVDAQTFETNSERYRPVR